ncbi:hypothetical protein [Saccharothrix australiensis]|uniref:Uncharacterized protein n=1 Tax=Saccharothrix australiensis TaxID=2072 RepID=A0A495W3L4_9PSEU|nr:hypothetical protein [Saccharothrix australiensis]RKT56266.1 hypothetical protein C8E97_4959 [Saccharothrix australiensis]
MTGLGAALTGTGLTWLLGLGVFALACRVSATEPRGSRVARRIAAWQRAVPWAAATCAVFVVTGAGLLLTSPP